MEDWFAVAGRTILLEALSEACDRVNDGFKNEFQAYNRKNTDLVAELDHLRQKDFEVKRFKDENTVLKATIDVLRRKDSQAERLREENAALKTEIYALKKACHQDTRELDTSKQIDSNHALRTPLAPKSINQLATLMDAENTNNEGPTLSEMKSEVARMGHKYQRLQDRYLDIQNVLRESNQLVRHRNDTIRNWEAHVSQLNKQLLKRTQRIKKLETKLAEIAPDSSPSSFSTDGGDAPTETGPQETTTPRRVHPSASLLNKDAELELAEDASPTRNIERPESPSRTTHNATASRPIPTTGGSNLEASGNSPRLPPLPRDIGGEGEEIRIKAEPSSDTPVVVSERCIRKRKQTDDGQTELRVAKVKVEHDAESQSIDEHRHFSPHESIDLDLENPSVQTPKKHVRYQQGQYMTPLGGVGARIPQDVRVGSALKFIVNDRVLRPPSVSVLNSKRQMPAATPRSLLKLAEDEQEYDDGVPLASKDQPRTDVLARYFNTPPTTRGKQGANSVDGERSIDPFQLPKKRDLPFGKVARKVTDLAYQTTPERRSDTGPGSGHSGGVIVDAPKERRRTGGGLRFQPKERLRLEDFKVNPDANGGHDYAFKDVVRNRDERACLQGCVEEKCCGRKWRALARNCRARTRPLEFQGLLESYLGDDCHRLSTMSDTEKEELWVEAKTRELANAHSRHRHRFPRMSTPPGFWRPDFPSTQEGEADSDEAARMERDIIEERCREAMRPGGLWIFRDE
ncbi:SAE2-domain-containing protein [Poronia punctata]|nr:SAE2-domain-containing protein [Poronia punctata]